MKTLIILRHGKAEIGDFDMDDFERSLIDKGRKNALDMGIFLTMKRILPEVIMASSAKRASETALLVCEHLNYAKEKIQFEPDLYLASARRILKNIEKINDNVSSCLIVAHNPGLTELVNDFGIKLDNLSTSSAVCFEFETEKWNKIAAKNATFKWIQLAKNL